MQLLVSFLFDFLSLFLVSASALSLPADDFPGNGTTLNVPVK